MTWARLESDAPSHPKIVGIGIDGWGLFSASICYANHHLTDGFIPGRALSAVFPGEPVRRLMALAVKLVEAGLWEKRETGWQIHDYANYQPTRDEVVAKRRDEHAAKVAAGMARATMATRIKGRFVGANGASSEPADDQQPAGGSAQQDASGPPADDQQANVCAAQQATSPTPHHTVTTKKQTPLGDEFGVFWTAYPKKKKRGAARRAWLKERPPLDQVLAAVAAQRRSEDWLKERGRFIPYPATWINAQCWLDEPMVLSEAKRPHFGPSS